MTPTVQSFQRTFREKMRTSSFVFRNLFHEISHFFPEIKEVKMRKRSEIFALFCSRNFSFRFFAKIMLFSWSKFKRNFAKKAKIFAFFVSERNAKKCKIFAKLFSFFAGNPSIVPLNLSLFRTILTGGRLDESGTEVWGQGLYLVGLFR